MKKLLRRSVLSGEVTIPPSKSVAHRALICAALSKKRIEVVCPNSNDDIDATVSCLRSLGCKIERTSSAFVVDGTMNASAPTLDCFESGSTLRFFVPIVAALGVSATFQGAGRLPTRPMDELFDVLKKNGVSVKTPRGSSLPCTVYGKLELGEYEIRGDVSSQYITGLLFALAVLKAGSIKVTTKIESKPYIDITLGVLKEFGHEISFEDGVFVYRGETHEPPSTYVVEGDHSSASFFVAAALLGAKDKLTLRGLRNDTLQGDRAIFDIAERFGGKTEFEDGLIAVFSSRLHSCKLDVTHTPDLAPVIAVLATAAEGQTEITGCARLRAKESDRVESTIALIRSLGGTAYSSGDSIFVKGSSLSGGVVDSFGDHRIAMAAAVASLVCEGDVVIDGAESVKKSFPSFFELFATLGAKVETIEV